MNVNIQGLAFLAVQNTFLPPEGPKAIPLTFDFTAASEYDLIVADLYQKGSGFPGISGLQTLYVDNGAGTEPLIIQISGSGQEITVAPGKQGYFPVISPKQGFVSFKSEAAIARVILLNFPCSAAEWSVT